MQVGIDLEKNDRFDKFTDKALSKIFTDQELDYAKKFANKNEHLIAFWCCKEAVIKAIGNRQIPLTDIEVIHNDCGKPKINLEKLSKYIEKNSQIEISISHSIDYSTAICLIY